ALEKLFAALWALFIQRLIRQAGLARPGCQAARGFAIGIAGTGEESTETPALNDHFAAAIVAILDGVGAFHFFAGVSDIANVIAIGVTFAAEEKTVPADSFKELALAAFRANLVGRNPGLVGLHFAFGFFEIVLETFPETLDGFAPGELAFLDFVELIFKARGEADVENILEAFDEELGHFFTEQSGREAALIFGDVLALDDSGDNRGICRWATNAFIFEFFD